ncbi:hypothetical protein MKW98_029438 [Papaver atlanticum]|uniref:F-box domain-containing protein n=1 Tax=Papaver atlanticum TaxID=357466 RepID=A0AAD4XSG4_9MAGN|nr:hypothetical protein MKW98_029438 [Papaver atlanticum]
MVMSKRILDEKFLIQWFGKTYNDGRPCKIRRICREGPYSITNLPGDCLEHIFKCLPTEDRNCFGLTCRQWLHIQNNNREHLWFLYPKKKCAVTPKPSINPESFHVVVCKLLVRFQNLKYLSLSRLPKITDFVALTSQLFGSMVQTLNLDCCEYSDIEFSLIFSWFPRLKNVRLIWTHITDKGLEALAERCSSLETIDLSCCSITDKGLEALAKCCSSLKEVKLSGCRSITDSGISFLIQNCGELHTLSIDSCSKITGIGFLGCAQILSSLTVGGCKLNEDGINAIISGGGLEFLSFEAPCESVEVGEKSINTEAVIKILKACPSLKDLNLKNCEDVELEAWEAIGQNCKNLKRLAVYGCLKLCDLGLRALREGCNNLSSLSVDNKNSCSKSAPERFRRERPDVTVNIKCMVKKDIIQEWL